MECKSEPKTITGALYKLTVSGIVFTKYTVPVSELLVFGDNIFVAVEGVKDGIGCASAAIDAGSSIFILLV